MDDTINALKKANDDLNNMIADLDEMLKSEIADIDDMLKADDLAPEGMRYLNVLKITGTLRLFREICKDKNRPDHPCIHCQLWNVCGTLPGNLDDETIDKTAEAAADYLQKKEAADDEERSNNDNR